MDKPNQQTKNSFHLKSDKEKLEIINRHIEKFQGGNKTMLIDQALKYNVAGELVSNPNFRF